MIQITHTVIIPESEITFISSRSSGPGGQHVNKVNTRITLRFNVLASPSLSEEQKQRILDSLKGRINRGGVLQISSQGSRSQFTNKEAVLSRFIELLRKSLIRKPLRKKTRIPKAVKKRRLEQKKQHSIKKKMRAKKDD